jgi:hypothetical protein
MKSFDTIHLSVPDDCIDISKKLKNYSYGQRYNSETHEIIEKGLSEDRLNPNVKQNRKLSNVLRNPGFANALLAVRF